MKDVYIGKGKLAGKGVYAARDFKKGELVTTWNLEELSRDDFDKLPESEHIFVHSFYGKMFLFPEPSRYTNHSAKPTVRSGFEKQCDYAISDIKKGEPITINSRLEIEHELKTFAQNYEKASINDFEWLKGGYRNATISYSLQSGTKKTLILKREDGNWRILDKNFKIK